MNFTGIWGVYEFQNKYVITGKNGTALFYNGAAWQQDTTGTDEDLYGALYADYDNIYAIGGLGRLLHRGYEDTGWEMNLSGAGETLRSIWGYSPTNIFIAGDNGIIMTYNPQQGTINRLLCEHRKTEAGATIYKIEYIFDNNQAKNGNIHKVIYDNTNVTEFTYNEMNELTEITHPDSSTETLTYDDNGNLTQTTRNGETTSYQWDCQDRLKKVILQNNEFTEFKYDESGNLEEMVEESVNRKFVIYNNYAIKETIKNNRDEWEISSLNIVSNNLPYRLPGEIGGKLLSTYIFTSKNNGIRENISNVLYYHIDHLGSARLITDSNGSIVDKYMTNAYGDSIPYDGKSLNEVSFVGTFGIKFVHKIKMYNARLRWLSNKIYRFISEDPIYDENRFVYAGSNPVRFIDISGLKKIPSSVTLIGGGVYGWDGGWHTQKNINIRDYWIGGKMIYHTNLFYDTLRYWRFIFWNVHGNFAGSSQHNRNAKTPIKYGEAYITGPGWQLKASDLARRVPPADQQKNEIVYALSCLLGGEALFRPNTTRTGTGDPSKINYSMAEALQAGKKFNDRTRIFVGFQTTTGYEHYHIGEKFAVCLSGSKNLDWRYCMKNSLEEFYNNKKDSNLKNAKFTVEEFNFHSTIPALMYRKNNTSCFAPIVVFGAKK